ncbi:hypothetical protein A0J61_10321 [Choanephora cucurbitarum]|uniref:Uncharacterized protein n=1 Tax=Choanephora cucurbitarum TaxID=101091 RepID=A0A1C7MXY9_9FUNG|nr:hypothetical protein A0J61_10321 [Choanephora cucurbitarum]
MSSIFWLKISFNSYQISPREKGNSLPLKKMVSPAIKVLMQHDGKIHIQRKPLSTGHSRVLLPTPLSTFGRLLNNKIGSDKCYSMLDWRQAVMDAKAGLENYKFSLSNK